MVLIEIAKIDLGNLTEAIFLYENLDNSEIKIFSSTGHKILFKTALIDDYIVFKLYLKKKIADYIEDPSKLSNYKPDSTYELHFSGVNW